MNALRALVVVWTVSCVLANSAVMIQENLENKKGVIMKGKERAGGRGACDIFYVSVRNEIGGLEQSRKSRGVREWKGSEPILLLWYPTGILGD